MALLVFDIPDNRLDRIVDAICYRFGEQPSGDVPARREFAKEHLKSYITEIVKSVEAEQSAHQARLDSDVRVENELGDISVDLT